MECAQHTQAPAQIAYRQLIFFKMHTPAKAVTIYSNCTLIKGAWQMLSTLHTCLENVYFGPEMTLNRVCSVFPNISSKFSTILQYHKKSLLMKILHTLTDTADFINMRSQYSPKHALKI